MVKVIHLDGVPSRSITLSDEGYDEILALVAQYRRCRRHGCTYSDRNPLVGINLFLGCFLEEHWQLTYGGPFGEPDEEGRQTYKFLDEEGYVFLSTADRSERPTRNVFETLQQWGFSVPETYTHPTKGQVWRLWPLNWSIYGNVPTSSVLVAENGYDSRLTVAYLTYKHGDFKELTKCRSETKVLLQRVEETIQATKDAEGYYHVGIYPTRWVSEAQRYHLMSELESAIYDVQLRLQRNKPAAVQQDEQQEVST